MRVESLVSSLPAVGDAQPKADGHATFEAAGAAVTGVVYRLDAETVKDASIDLCVGSGVGAVPHQAGCELGQSGVAEYDQISYYQCGDPLPTLLCLPASTGPVSVIHGVASLVVNGSHASYDLTAKALRSRASGWAFTFRF
jgi:hypothetical protein